MRVLVTGGAGYIGSHAAKALAREGHDPVVYDNLYRGHRSAVRWGPFVHGDIRDRARLQAVMNEYKPDVVLHFAALAYVGESLLKPQDYYSMNVGGSMAILDAMRNCEISAIVFSSTCATYGNANILPITEDTIQTPVSPYGYTKLVVERMLSDYERAFGIRYFALRYFNAAGCDNEGELGEDHDPETHALPLAILAALRRTPPFRIFGSDYPTRDGTAIRDYIHVGDLAIAHVKAAELLHAGASSRCLNLGTGVGISVAELVATVERVSGLDVPVTHHPRRLGDPPVLFADGSRARRELNWAPALADIEAIASTAVSWFRRN